MSADAAIDVEAAVKRFMEACGQGRDESEQNIALRFRLMDEEHDEVVEAINYGDRVQIAKELCDLVYVAVGTAVAFGIPFAECFSALQFSNMSKIREDGTADFREDGKVLKGVDFRPAEPMIRDILGE